MKFDVADLQSVVAENVRAWERIPLGANDRLDWAALGYSIPNIYGVIESYCLRIAKFFENGLEGESWHRELVFLPAAKVGGTHALGWEPRVLLE